MSETKHTPGPWSVAETQEGTLIKSDVEPGYFARIQGACAGAHGKQGAANARLIAAAPELLAACKATVAAMSQPVFTNAGTIIKGDVEFATRVLCAAIEKAEGR